MPARDASATSTDLGASGVSVYHQPQIIISDLTSPQIRYLAKMLSVPLYSLQHS